MLAGHYDKDGLPCVAINLLQDAVPNESISPCISTGNPKTGQANIGVVYAIDRAAFNQGQNAQYKIQIDENGIAHTLVAKGPGAVCYPVGIKGDIAGTLDASYWKGCGERNGTEREVVACPTKTKWIVRRVTPTECARLQGMPDWWCDGVKHFDSAEYKMWGNGMALPCVMYVMQNLSAAGTIRRYFAAYCQYSSRYDRYKAGELPNAFNPELSNGAVMDIGIYTIYPLVVLFGKPDSIQATSVKLPSGVDGEGSVLMRYKNGMDAVVLYSKIADSTLTAEIQGEAGTIQLSRINVLSAPTFYPRPTEKHGTTTGISWAQPDNHDHYYHEVSEFMDVILNGQHQSTLNSHQNSLTTIEIIDEIRRQSGIVYPADAAKS